MIAILGGTGFVGTALTRALVDRGEPVRVLVRDPGRAARRLGDAASRVEVVTGDMHDPAALDALLDGARAVYVLVQTVTARQPRSAGDFAAAEEAATRLVLAAARRAGVSRLLTVGLIGARPGARNAWVRSRARLEAATLDAGLDATVLRAGLVVGVGSVGFDGIVAAAGRRVAVIRGAGRQHWSYVALDDLVAHLVLALDDRRTVGRAIDVGSAQAPTYRELVARAAAVLGRPAPRLVPLPLGVLRTVAPVLERVGGLPRGGLRAAVDHLGDDLVGDVSAARELLGREPMGWEDAVRAALPGLGAPHRPAAEARAGLGA